MGKAGAAVVPAPPSERLFVLATLREECEEGAKAAATFALDVEAVAAVAAVAAAAVPEAEDAIVECDATDAESRRLSLRLVLRIELSTLKLRPLSLFLKSEDY